MPSTAKGNALSPITIGVMLAGLLMFVVVGVVRNVTTKVTDIKIQTAVGAGITAVQAAPLQSNVGNALPIFTLTQQPVAQPLPTLAPVIFQSPEQLAAFNNPDWLSVAYGSAGEKVVWAGAWFSCRHIDSNLLTFNTIRTDPALAIWVGLAPNDQWAVAKECSKP